MVIHLKDKSRQLPTKVVKHAKDILLINCDTVQPW